MPTIHFDLAPPAKVVDSLLAVPIDIQTVRAQYRFDAQSQRGMADATIEYVVGPSTGNPVFDLRQTISAAWLDGVEFPVDQLAAHNVDPAVFTTVRIIGQQQLAGSSHTLRVTYPLTAPKSQFDVAGPGYEATLAWTGERLRWSFGLSDLNAGRYLEAWAPANLMFDQYAITLDVAIAGTELPHVLITNGEVSLLGPNHWTIQFPDRFTALSPLFDLRAADTVTSASDTVVLPVSHKTVTIEAWRPTDVGVDLPTQIGRIKGFLAENETDYGPYLHGNRFVAFFVADDSAELGGMEYEGGTTTDPSSLRHETFHSWFSRGVKPAGQADGWWDEAFTVYHEDGANGTAAFDFARPPVQLCSLDPWARNTPIASYSAGEDIWKGIAAIVGPAQIKTAMADFYRRYAGQEPATTAMLEETLVGDLGAPGIVDGFHRFVYGFADASKPPRLSLRGAGHSWNSSELWVRNTDDGGTTHQPPVPGRDNWFYARVTNDATAGACQHAVVTFHCTQVAATHVSFPGDFLPSIAARAAFAIAPGESQIVKALWPAASIPPAGSHYCLLAAALARLDQPSNGPAGPQRNLAIKNVSIEAVQAL